MLKALSIRQPWAWLIVSGLKDIENRSWDTAHRGETLVHAGVRRPSEDELLAIEEDYDVVIDRAALQFGGVIGAVNVTGMVEDHASKWFLGPIGWTLSDARSLPFQKCRGALGLFFPKV